MEKKISTPGLKCWEEQESVSQLVVHWRQTTTHTPRGWAASKLSDHILKNTQSQEIRSLLNYDRCQGLFPYT